MNEELWAGAELKIEYGRFHLHQMEMPINPRALTDVYEVLDAQGHIFETGWQQSFYPHFDAFLSVVRSIPEIIRCCFGVDSAQQMRSWFNGLPAAERDSRHKFQKQYAKSYEAFRLLPLGNARHISEHRTGVPDVEVTISSQFGVIHRGSPTALVPTSETPKIDNPNAAVFAKPRRLHPRWEDFTIEGRPLFPECQEYLERARTLIECARQLSLQVHGAIKLTPPPS